MPETIQKLPRVCGLCSCVRVAGFQDSKVLGFKDSRASRLQGSRVSGFPGSKVPGFQGSRVSGVPPPGFQGSRVQFRILGSAVGRGTTVRPRD